MTPPNEAKESMGPSVLERQMQIMEEVAKSQLGLSFSELQRLLGLPKGTMLRLVDGLRRADLLELSTTAGRRFQIGKRIRRLLALSVSTHHVVETSRPVLQELVRMFEETAFLAGLRDGQVEAVAMVTPVEEWRGHVQPGRVMPAHAAASAKAIFAFQDEEVFQAALPSELYRFTPRTLDSLPAVLEEYRHVREKGIAVCREEIDPGQMALAAPVSVQNLGVVYSICIAGPVGRLDSVGIDKIADALRASASKLETQLIRKIEHSDY